MMDKTSLKSAPPATNTHSPNNRLAQLERWLQQVFTTQRFTLHSLPGDASARQYHRLELLDEERVSGRYIVMDAADEQEAMRQFISVAKLMSAAVNVPEIIAQDVSQGFLVLQDFGTTEFAHLLVDATPVQVNAHYQLAMQTLVALQTIPVETAKSQYQLPDYDAALLDREMDLFSDWFVPYLGLTVDKSLWTEVKSALIKEVLSQPQVIVHRDYHSRNLMQDQADDARLGVIDFQDAVVGAYTYDLVSLLRDAYVEWSERQVSAWAHDFWQLQKHAGLTMVEEIKQLENDMNVMGVQRHLKVLGIFIRLSERDGKDRYLADIPKVMRDLLYELEWLEVHGSPHIQQAVAPFNEYLTEIILPAYQHKFVQQYI